MCKVNKQYYSTELLKIVEKECSNIPNHSTAYWCFQCRLQFVKNSNQPNDLDNSTQIGENSSMLIGENVKMIGGLDYQPVKDQGDETQDDPLLTFPVVAYIML